MNDDPFELPLFDAPLRKPPQERTARSPREGERPADDDPDRVPVEHLTVEPPPEPDDGEVPDFAQAATLGPRLAAGITDLVIHGALLGLLIGGSSTLGVEIASRHAAPLAIVLLLFSFLYHVVPLTFWGYTPGMAVAGLRARTLDDEPLTLQQAVRRWLALLVTALTLGLGVLLALAGRSLADRASGSQTLMQ